MKKYFFGLAVVLAAVSMVACTAPRIDKQTRSYAEKGDLDLQLDIYRETGAGTQPCLLFVFGGGFMGGERDAEQYLPFFEHMARAGYTVAAIDYRLGLKGIDPSAMDAEGFVRSLAGAINMAVEDLFDATAFLVGEAGQIGIDPERIVACGSSAGAITVLQGAYERANRTALAERLPEGFHYAGVVAFAGAIFDVTGTPVWKEKPCPIMMFHGDADATVPYKEITYGNIGFYGSHAIARQLSALQAPYSFYSVANAGHEYAVVPMNDFRAEIECFLDQLVWEHRPLMINTSVDEIGLPERKKDFLLEDYIRNNLTE